MLQRPSLGNVFGGKGPTTSAVELPLDAMQVNRVSPIHVESACMLSEFASWYMARVGEFLPGVLSGRAHPQPNSLVVVVDQLCGPASFTFCLRERGKETPMALPPGGRSWPDVVVRLRRGALLERVVNLPLAAEAGLTRVLGFEMDRYTRFSVAEVYWSSLVISRSHDQGRLLARLLLLPRTSLAALLEQLAVCGVVPTAVEGSGLDGGLRRLSLRDDGAEGERGSWSLLAACVLAGVLGLATAGLPFLRQHWAAEAIEARIAALQPAVTEADALRRRLLDQAAGSDAIAAEEVRLGEPLQALSALTELLPDDTFLTGLALHLRQVTIDGSSGSAARLIGLLSADPVIRNAAFAAPVTRGDDGRDVFSIKAEVKS